MTMSIGIYGTIILLLSIISIRQLEFATDDLVLNPQNATMDSNRNLSEKNYRFQSIPPEIIPVYIKTISQMKFNFYRNQTIIGHEIDSVLKTQTDSL